MVAPGVHTPKLASRWFRVASLHVLGAHVAPSTSIARWSHPLPLAVLATHVASLHGVLACRCLAFDTPCCGVVHSQIFPAFFAKKENSSFLFTLCFSKRSERN